MRKTIQYMIDNLVLPNGFKNLTNDVTVNTVAVALGCQVEELAFKLDKKMIEKAKKDAGAKN